MWTLCSTNLYLHLAISPRDYVAITSSNKFMADFDPVCLADDDIFYRADKKFIFIICVQQYILTSWFQMIFRDF